MTKERPSADLRAFIARFLMHPPRPAGMSPREYRRTLAAGPAALAMLFVAAGESACSATADYAAPLVGERTCTDRVDDDSDGQIDCADPDCVWDPACRPSTGGAGSEGGAAGAASGGSVGIGGSTPGGAGGTQSSGGAKAGGD